MPHRLCVDPVGQPELFTVRRMDGPADLPPTDTRASTPRC